MGEFDLNPAGWNVVRWAGAGAAAVMLAGCSPDTSRLAAGVDYTPTATISSGQLVPPEAIGQGGAGPSAPAPSGSSWSPAPVRPASSGAIQSAPLAPVGAPSTPTRPAYQAAPIPQRAAPAALASPVAPALASPVQAAAGSFGPWTTAGGTPVTVGSNDSASVIAARYGVPQEALLRSNGLTSAAQVRPGMQLTIPVYDASARSGASSAPAARPAAPQRPAAAPASTPAHAPARSADVARPQGQQTLAAPAQPGQQRVAALTPPAAPRSAEAPRAAAPEATRPQTQPKPQAAAKPEQPRQAAPAAAAKTEPEPPRVAAAPPADEKPEFRWPARGRIIQGFKTGASDGIAIAVPEGTAVKAAEAGVVAYAGNELKGYGNLVLIRHPNGFVSAYAHNGELSVKRGDTVKRGQVIAKSGQSGNVSSPQLHFELRKGSTPVDPTAYLAGL